MYEKHHGLKCSKTCSTCDFHSCNANLYDEEEIDFCSENFIKSKIECCDQCKYSICKKVRKDD